MVETRRKRFHPSDPLLYQPGVFHMCSTTHRSVHSLLHLINDAARDFKVNFASVHRLHCKSQNPDDSHRLWDVRKAKCAKNVCVPTFCKMALGALSSMLVTRFVIIWRSPAASAAGSPRLACMAQSILVQRQANAHVHEQAWSWPNARRMVCTRRLLVTPDSPMPVRGNTEDSKTV